MVELSWSVVAETGLSSSFVLKEIKLNELLNHWVILALENDFDYSLLGGTAVNKVYLDCPRFSEDVDLFVYGSTQARVGSVLKALEELAGVRVSKPRVIFGKALRWSLEYDFSENSVFGDKINFDVNLNLRERKSVAETVQMKSFLSKYGVPVVLPRVSTFRLETLAAMKLLTVCYREFGKDFFDLYNILSKNSFRKKTILDEACKYYRSFFDFAYFDEKFLERALQSVEETSADKLAEYDSYILASNRVDWRVVKRDLVKLIRTHIT